MRNSVYPYRYFIILRKQLNSFALSVHIPLASAIERKFRANIGPASSTAYNIGRYIALQCIVRNDSAISRVIKRGQAYSAMYRTISSLMTNCPELQSIYIRKALRKFSGIYIYTFDDDRSRNSSSSSSLAS